MMSLNETTNASAANGEQTPREGYAPHRLLDTLIQRMQLKNDAALCRALEVAPPLISKVRNRKLPLGSGLLIRMHEVSGMSINELRQLMGDRRNKYRASEAAFLKKTDGKQQQASA